MPKLFSFKNCIFIRFKRVQGDADFLLGIFGSIIDTVLVNHCFDKVFDKLRIVLIRVNHSMQDDRHSLGADTYKEIVLQIFQSINNFLVLEIQRSDLRGEILHVSSESVGKLDIFGDPLDGLCY